MNLFEGFSGNFDSEVFETLLEGKNVRIERIVSHGQTSPDDFWYDQNESEWVVVLEGSAVLRFEDEEVKMKRGDTLLIPAHKRHRVEHTDSPTVWLAVFFS